MDSAEVETTKCDRTPNVRGPILLLTARMPCWKCSVETVVGSIAATAEAEAWLEHLEPPRWVQFGEPEVLSTVVEMSREVQLAAQQLLPAFRMDHSNAMETTYLINHCDRCGTKIGDFFTQARGLGAPFFAWPRAGRNGIQVVSLGVGTVACAEPQIEPPEQRKRSPKKPSR